MYTNYIWLTSKTRQLKVRSVLLPVPGIFRPVIELRDRLPTLREMSIFACCEYSWVSKLEKQEGLISTKVVCARKVPKQRSGLQCHHTHALLIFISRVEILNSLSSLMLIWSIVIQLWANTYHRLNKILQTKQPQVVLPSSYQHNRHELNNCVL